MGLSEIAAGIEITRAQERREVTIVDETDATITERLAPFADVLPCQPDAAATAVERYAAGASVDTAARAAGLSPVTTKKLSTCSASQSRRSGRPTGPLSGTGSTETARDMRRSNGRRRLRRTACWRRTSRHTSRSRRPSEQSRGCSPHGASGAMGKKQ